MVLKSYQTKAVDELVDAAGNHLVTYRNGGSNVLLKAPTGAGKTVMLAGFIDRIIQNFPQTAFIWVSIGKGGLHVQSAERVRTMSSCATVITSDDIKAGSVQLLYPGNALFLSWEQLNSKNARSEWTNILMRDGENGNLPEIIKTTKKAHTELIVIIDESHSGAGTVRAAEIFEIIDATVRVMVSATPSDGEYHDIVEVDIKDVIADGMIKSNIVINPDLLYAVDDEGNLVQQGKAADVVTALLGAAIKKRIALQGYYKTNKSTVNPLILIQIPNSDEGSVMLNSIEATLNENYNINYDNGKLASWFSTMSGKRNIEDIEKNNASQECLIFKTAIDTGWDCPRAQILVKFRLMKSETFQRQIIGRILRMPEQKHYKNDRLNTAYIYTNERNFRFDTDKDTQSFRNEMEIKDLTSQVRNLFAQESIFVPTMTLPKDVTPKLHSIYLTKNVLLDIKNNWNELVQKSAGIGDKFDDIVNNTVIQTETVDWDLDNNISDIESAKLTRDEAHLDILLRKIISKVIKNKNTVQEIYGMLKDFRGSLMPVTRGRRRKNFFYDYFLILVNNEQSLLGYFERHLKDTKCWRYPQVEQANVTTDYISLSMTLNIPERFAVESHYAKCYFEHSVRTGDVRIDNIIEGYERDPDVCFWYPNWAITEKASKIRYASSYNGRWGYVSPDIVVRTVDGVNRLVFFAQTKMKELIIDDTLKNQLPIQVTNLPNIEFELVKLHEMDANSTSIDDDIANLRTALGLGLTTDSGGGTDVVGKIDDEDQNDYTVADSPSDDLATILNGIGGNLAHI